MKREDLLKEMRDSIGKDLPVDFFAKFVDVFTILFDKIDHLEKEIKATKRNTTLAIAWEPKIAADMLVKQIDVMRNDKDTYAVELVEFKRAYAEGRVVMRYDTFCEFWNNILGYHPFLQY